MCVSVCVLWQHTKTFADTRPRLSVITMNRVSVRVMGDTMAMVKSMSWSTGYDKDSGDDCFC